MPRPNALPCEHAIDVEKRLQKVEHALALIRDAAASRLQHDTQRRGAAIAQFAEDALDELYFVRRLPGFITNLPAPTDADIRRATGREVEDAGAELDAILREHLAAATKGGAR